MRKLFSELSRESEKRRHRGMPSFFCTVVGSGSDSQIGQYVAVLRAEVVTQGELHVVDLLAPLPVVETVVGVGEISGHLLAIGQRRDHLDRQHVARRTKQSQTAQHVGVVNEDQPRIDGLKLVEPFVLVCLLVDIRVLGELLRAVLRPPDLRTAVILVDVVPLVRPVCGGLLRNGDFDLRRAAGDGMMAVRDCCPKLGCRVIRMV